MDIILVRHGESQANAEKIYGEKHIKLTEKGIDQARQSRKTIEGLDFKDVYVSPMERAKETMRYLGLEGEVDDNLREVNLGILEGMTYDELLRDYPREAELWKDHPLTYALPEGESVVDTYNRVGESLDRIIEKGDNALLICHDGIIKAALSYVFNSVEYFFRFRSDNLGVSMIRIHEGYKYINYQNRIFWK